MADFSVSLQVRDHECDMQGVVNHAVYLNYLEHARHEFLKTRGLDFAKLTAGGIIVVVARAEIDYRRSLRSGDHFRVTARPQRASAVRLVFEQEILLERGGDCMVTAKMTTTAVNERGRPYFPRELEALFLSASKS